MQTVDHFISDVYKYVNEGNYQVLFPILLTENRVCFLIRGFTRACLKSRGKLCPTLKGL